MHLLSICFRWFQHLVAINKFRKSPQSTLAGLPPECGLHWSLVTGAGYRLHAPQSRMFIFCRLSPEGGHWIGCEPVENITVTFMDGTRLDTEHKHTQSNQSISASPGLFFDKCNFLVTEPRKSAEALSKLPLWCSQNRLFSKIVGV